MNTKVVEVIGQAKCIKLVSQGGEYVAIRKENIKLKLGTDAVWLYHDNKMGQAPEQVEDYCYKLTFEQVTNPEVASNLLLADAINAFLNI